MAVTGIAFLAGSSVQKIPRFVWNASASVAPGLYRIRNDPPRRGQIALVQLPPSLAALAIERGYLLGTALLLKPVAATGGDRVCRAGRTLFVRGRIAADISVRNAAVRPLPAWRGCRILGTREYVLLSPHRNSFDSRYFGPIEAANIVGTGQLVWSLPIPAR